MAEVEWPLKRWNHALGHGRPDAPVRQTSAAALHALAVERTELLDSMGRIGGYDDEEVASWTVASDAWFEIGDKKHAKWCARAVTAAKEGRSPLFTVHPGTVMTLGVRVPQACEPLRVVCDLHEEWLNESAVRGRFVLHPLVGYPYVRSIELGRLDDGFVPGSSYSSSCGGDRHLRYPVDVLYYPEPYCARP